MKSLIISVATLLLTSAIWCCKTGKKTTESNEKISIHDIAAGIRIQNTDLHLFDTIDVFQYVNTVEGTTETHPYRIIRAARINKNDTVQDSTSRITTSNSNRKNVSNSKNNQPRSVGAYHLKFLVICATIVLGLVFLTTFRFRRRS